MQCGTRDGVKVEGAQSIGRETCATDAACHPSGDGPHKPFKRTPVHWINEGNALPKIGQPVLVCSPRQFDKFWDMRVLCILVRHEGVSPLPVKAGSKWPTDYYWGDPRSGNDSHRLITGNAWWASFDAINLPPGAIHRFMGPRNDHVILQDGDVWIGQNKRSETV